MWRHRVYKTGEDIVKLINGVEESWGDANGGVLNVWVGWSVPGTSYLYREQREINFRHEWLQLFTSPFVVDALVK